MGKKSEIIKMIEEIEDAKCLSLIYILVSKLHRNGPPIN